METIQIEVSPELAQRLRPYQDELSDILEWALCQVEQERERQAEAKLLKEEVALLDVSEPSEDELAELAMRGGALDWLADEPDLYSDNDLEERFDWATA